MRNTKKAISILLTLLMVVGMMSTFAFAAEQMESMGSGQGSITVKNPMKNDTYTLYKIFNAKLGSNDTSISYTKIDDIDYDDIVGDTGKIFKEEAKNIYYAGTSTSGELTATDVSGLTAFVKKAENAKLKVGNTITSNGESTLKFTGLSYGYYVVVATRGMDSVISVDSTNKNAEIINKNDGTPDLSGSKKAFASKADAEANNESRITDVYAGQKVWYRAEIGTGNYVTSGGAVKTVLEYTIEDTLPSFLKNVNVESITIDGADYKVGGTTPQFNNNNKIIIPWVNNETAKTPLYKDGAKIVIIYSADIDASGLNYSEDGNKNVITPSYRYDGGTGGGSSDKIIDTVYSYALAIKKINNEGTELTGAKFTISGYTLTAPTNVNGTNVYTITGKDASANTAFEVGTNGQVIIKGLDANAVTITETEAPEGYNKLRDSISITPEKVSSTTTTKTIYLDENGKEVNRVTEITSVITSDVPATFLPVVNMKGTELPSTGGIGTTIFYLIGAILVIGAGVVFVTRRRMHSDK